jgi:predicted permease
VLGDLEEAHRARLGRHSRFAAHLLTSLDALDTARALLRERARSRGAAASGARGRARFRPRGRFAAVSWLDVKLGVRMLTKHPALSLVSGFGMTVAVAIGAVGFGVIRVVTASELPLDEGERVVTVQNTGGTGGLDQFRSTPLHDLATWRKEVRSLAELGAYRVVTRNLVTPDGRVAPARTIEMTASGFRISRVPPLLGRYLIDADEQKGAEPVVVIGYRVWRDQFAASPDVVGQTLLIGATPHTVVGVMPEGFAFPINNRVWTPLELDPLDYELGAAPDIDVFGRLAPGATLSEAQAQLSELGLRAAALHPETHGRIQPRVFPYAQELFGGPMVWLLYVGQLLLSMLLMVIAVNVAVLMYARTATRTSEILVRTALGASRGRIATQLFAEALVLSSAAAGVGLLVAGWALRQIERAVSFSGGEQMPFWWDFELSSSTALYAFALAAVSAVIIGVVPALGATGRHLQAGLQSVGSSRSGLQLGRTWTALIVAQVAAAVAVLPVALNITLGQWFRSGESGPEYATGEFLWASLALDQETIPVVGPAATVVAPGATEDPRARYTRLQAEVVARLEADAQLSQVIVMGPAPWQDPDLRIEVQDAPSTWVQDSGEFHLPTGAYGGWSRMDTDFIEAFGVPLLVGRPFEPRDAATEAAVVIVSQSFVDRVLGGGSALGRNIRPVGSSSDRELGTTGGNWYTIIGVVPDFPEAVGPLRTEPKVYQPLGLGAGDRASFAVRVRAGDPERFVGRLREIVADVDPMLRLPDVAPLDDVLRRGLDQLIMIAIGIAAVAASVLLLSVAGLYALMSFTILGRRREIGIRSALGAPHHRILSGILFRAMAQLALGILAGSALSGLMDRATGGGLLSGRAPFILPAVAVLMVGVGLLAAWGPARRGLRIQPTEALRSE